MAPTTRQGWLERQVLVGAHGLEGSLELPPGARALVVFAHGSGSSRLSVRNRRVAGELHRQGLGTLLFDLLRPDEAADRRLVFDIPLLGRRLVDAIDWVDAASGPASQGRAEQGRLSRRPHLPDLPFSPRLPIGLFGASTGAAAALTAAVQRPGRVYAVVSRGGRPDLAEALLAQVEAPTLLIVGGADTEVLALNRQAQARLRSCELAVVPQATHLFEEPGALDQVARLAARWFSERLPAPA